MATTVNSNLVIYEDQAQTAYLERIQDVIQIFNAASGNTLQFRNELIEGNLKQRAFYKIGGSIAHRDVNSTSAVSGTAISADEMVGVKIPWKYGPYETTEEAFKRRARSPEEFSSLVGQDMADAVLEGWVEFALKGLRAAIRSNAAMVVSDAAIATDGKKILTKGLRTMGDRFERVTTWIMDSGMYFDIVDQAIDNKVFEEAGVVIYGGQPGTLGRPVLVTDKCPANVIYGVQPGAIVVTESQAPGMRTYNIDSQENLAIGFRAEGTFNLELMGYSWDAVAGGTNPDLTKVSDPDNWDKYATSNKVTAGFVIDLNAS